MTLNGLYKVKDEYFIDFLNENHIFNKSGRPFYYAVADKNGIYWFIPLSTQVDSYKQKIASIEAKRGVGKCLTYHIGMAMGRQQVFRICDMIPVTARYIECAYISNGKPYVVEIESLITAVSRKARDFIKQLELGRMHSQVDALSIRKTLETNL